MVTIEQLKKDLESEDYYTLKKYEGTQLKAELRIGTAYVKILKVDKNLDDDILIYYFILQLHPESKTFIYRCADEVEYPYYFSKLIKHSFEITKDDIIKLFMELIDTRLKI